MAVREHPMRSTLFLSAALCAGLFFGCAHSAYGPTSDQRLENSLSEGASTEGADATAIKCADLKKKFDESRDADVPEGDRMHKMTDVFTNAKERSTKLDEAVSKNPDLLFGGNADVIKANLDECRSFYAEVRSDFDRFIRDVCDLPVIKDVASNKDVARLDLGVLRGAIVALDPDDKDVLIGKVETAEKKTGYTKAAAPTPATDKSGDKGDEPPPPKKGGKKK